MPRLFRSELNNRETLTSIDNRGCNVVITWHGRDIRGAGGAQSWYSRMGRVPIVNGSRVLLVPTALPHSHYQTKTHPTQQRQSPDCAKIIPRLNRIVLRRTRLHRDSPVRAT